MTILRIVYGRDEPETLRTIGVLRIHGWGEIMGREAARKRFGLDRHDRESWQFVVEDGDLLVASGRLTPCSEYDDLPEEKSLGPHRHRMKLPVGVAGRLVVHRSYRGRGLAEQIIVARLDLARELGLKQVWGETRLGDLPGLTRHGYEVVGASLDTSVPGEWSIACAPL